MRALVVLLLFGALTLAPLPARTQEGANRKITVNFRDVPLRKAIDLLFEGSGLRYSVDPNVPDVAVTLNIRDIGLQQAVRLLVKQASSVVPDLAVARDGELFTIRIRAAAARTGRPARVTVPREDPPAAIRSEPVWETIPLHYLDVVAVTIMLGGHVLPAGEDVPILPLPGAAAPARRGAIEPHSRVASSPPDAGPGGISIVQLDPPSPPAASVRGSLTASMPPITVPAGIQSIIGVSGSNSLVVRGTREAIQELKDLIRLMDVPQRQVRIRLSAGKLTAEGQTVNNAPLLLAAVSGADRMDAVLTPRVNSDNTIEVTLEGTLTVNGTPRPVASRVRLASGRTIEAVTLEEGSRLTHVWIRASLAQDPTASGPARIRRGTGAPARGGKAGGGKAGTARP
jgi:hypothetical protein